MKRTIPAACLLNWLHAYNGHKFDVPFLIAACERYKVTMNQNVTYYCDPLEITRSLVLHPIPSDRSLSSMYKRATGKDLKKAHSAAMDVSALIEIVKWDAVWDQMHKKTQGDE